MYRGYHVYHLFISLTHLTKTNDRTRVRQEEYLIPTLTRTTTFRVGTATLWGCPDPGTPDRVKSSQVTLYLGLWQKSAPWEVMVLCNISQ